MQRHGGDQIALFQNRASAAAEPAGETGNQIQPVGMFQRQNRAAAFLVIGENCAGGVERRRLCQAGGAQTLHRHRKGQAAADATRPIQKTDSAPALGAKSGLRDLRAAADAVRRKQQIQNRFGDFCDHNS